MLVKYVNPEIQLYVDMYTIQDIYAYLPDNTYRYRKVVITSNL